MWILLLLAVIAWFVLGSGFTLGVYEVSFYSDDDPEVMVVYEDHGWLATRILIWLANLRPPVRGRYEIRRIGWF